MLPITLLLSAHLATAPLQKVVAALVPDQSASAQTQKWGNFVLHTGVDGRALQQFKQRYPATWFVWDDPETGFPARLYGSGVPLVTPPLETGTVLPAARSFLETSKDMLGLGDLRALPAQRSAADSRFIEFRFLKAGIPLEEHSRVGLVIKENGVLALIKSDRIPKSFESTTPAVTAKRAQDKAFTSLDVRRKDFSVSSPVLTYYVVRGTARLAWRFRIMNNSLDNPVAKEFFVHARGRGEILEVREGIIHAYSGDVSSFAVLGNTYDQPLWTPVDQAYVTMLNGGGSTTTDATGNFSFSNGSGNQTIESKLEGRWSKIDNQGGSNSDLTMTAGAGDNFHFTHNTSGNEFSTAETTGYKWVTGVHDWSQATLTNNGMNFQVLTNVNINNSCNANWDPGANTLNFFRAKNGCSNTAHDKTVIAHEYGHGIDDGLGSILDIWYSEGFGDALAMNFNNESCVGVDFYGPGQCLRDGNAIVFWPGTSCGNDEHCYGSIYAQFTWEYTKMLKSELGDSSGLAIAKNLVLLPASYNSTDIPDAVMDTFIADDNDGNLTNETPHFCEIQKAADSRKLPYNILTNIVYVDGGASGEERGTCSKPYNTVREGVSATPSGGTLRIDAGNYPESNITANTSMTMEAQNGSATIGQ